MFSSTKSILLLILIWLLAAQQPQPVYLLQLTPLIDNKPLRSATPIRIQLIKNQSIPLSYNLSLSSTNFHKNVSLKIQLFARSTSQSNQNLISKGSKLLRTLYYNPEITDRRKIISQRAQLMLRLLKFHDNKNVVTKVPIILLEAPIYVSYSDQGPQLEDANLFVKNSNYIAVQELGKDREKVNTTLVFHLINRTDIFQQNKKKLNQLNQLNVRVAEPIPLIAYPLAKQIIQPLQIWENIRKNIISLEKYQSKVAQKLDFIQYYQIRTFLANNIGRFQFTGHLSIVKQYLARFNLTIKDNIIPVAQWIFHQPSITNKIVEIQESILLSVTSEDVVKKVEEIAEQKSKYGIIIFVLWIFLDLLSYLNVARNIGISRSYGTFLNIWILIQLVNWSIRFAFSIHYLFGLGTFLFGFALHWLISWALQRRFNSFCHSGTNCDKSGTSTIKNALILVIAINLYFHLFQGINISSLLTEGFAVFGKINTNPVLTLLWGYGEFIQVVQQYYYFCVIFPQILLNFKLKNTQKFILPRLVLLFWWGIQGRTISMGNEHWAFSLLQLKQLILFGLLLLQYLLYRNNKPVEPLPKQIEFFCESEAESTPEEEVQNKSAQKEEVQNKVLLKQEASTTKKNKNKATQQSNKKPKS